jgi:arabinofuranan 3-O-arabinosyltransferase
MQKLTPNWIVIPLALAGMLAYSVPLSGFIGALISEPIVATVVDRDFANYWMAGQLIRVGQFLALFTQDHYYALLQQVFGEGYPIHNWSYPPHFLLLLWPLGYVSYKAGLVLFLLSTFVLFVGSLIAFRQEHAPNSPIVLLALAVTSYTFMMVDTAQNGFLTSALLLSGLALMRTRPIVASVAFALLTIKPQLGLFIPVLLLFEKNWRVIVWTSVFTALLIGISALAFGVESWLLYLNETVEYQRFVMTDWYGIFLRMMPTLFASMRTLGFTADTAFAVQAPLTIAGLALVLWLLWRTQDLPRRIFIILCGTFVVSPYGFNYDMGALAVSAVLLVASDKRLTAFELVSIATVSVLPAIVMNIGRMNLPVAPLILTSGLVSLALTLIPSRSVGQHVTNPH